MNNPLVEICMQDLFADLGDLQAKYQKHTVDAVLRLRDMYLWIVARPSAKDNEFVKEECQRYKISRPTAYSDLAIIKALLPNIAESSKAFNTWRFTEMILETYNLAKLKKDVRTMERSAGTYAKYMGLDKVEEEQLPLDKIIVQPFIPHDDPSVLGFEAIPNRRERIKQLIQKYSKDVPEIIDIKEESADIDAMLDHNLNTDNLQENGQRKNDS